MPLSGLEKEEIIALAVRAERKQRRRTWTAAIVAACLAAVLISALLIWGGLTLRNILDAQTEQAERDAARAEFERNRTQETLDAIDSRLVPRSEFVRIEQQLLDQRFQLKKQERQLRRQRHALRRIERGVAALTRSG